MRWLVTFVAVAGLDFTWSLCVASVKGGEPLQAGGWAVLFFLLGAVSVLEYTRNRWLLIPGALGAFAGTALGVLWIR